jgi:dGTPase
VEKIYKLNLTYGVKDGIISHNGEKLEQEIRPSKEKNDFEVISKSNTLSMTPTSYEGCIVRFADKIAYLGRDLEDAIKGKFILKSDVPDKVRNELSYEDGKFSNSSIINNFIVDIIKNSKSDDRIKFSNEKFEALKELMDFNYKFIYFHATLSKYKKHVNKMISALYDHLFELYKKYKNDYDCYEGLGGVAKSFGGFLEKNEDVYKEEQDMPTALLVDYISGMTDDYALQCMKEISMPKTLSFDEDNVLR